MKIDGSLAAGLPLESGQTDDFDKLIHRLADPDVGGSSIFSPAIYCGVPEFGVQLPVPMRRSGRPSHIAGR